MSHVDSPIIYEIECSYEINIIDSPKEMHEEIKEKS